MPRPFTALIGSDRMPHISTPPQPFDERSIRSLPTGPIPPPLVDTPYRRIGVVSWAADPATKEAPNLLQSTMYDPEAILVHGSQESAREVCSTKAFKLRFRFLKHKRDGDQTPGERHVPGESLDEKEKLVLQILDKYKWIESGAMQYPRKSLITDTLT